MKQGDIICWQYVHEETGRYSTSNTFFLTLEPLIIIAYWRIKSIKPKTND